MNKAQRLAWLPDRVIDAMAQACGESRDTPREDLVIAYQMSQGLEADGWPGRKTARALYGADVAVPRNRRAVKRAFGPMPWKKTGRGRGIKWTGAKPDIVKIDLYNGDTLRVWRPIAKEIAALFELACEASGYVPKSTACYVARVIGGTDRLSMHAYGIAIDFDPRLNPWGVTRSNGKPQPIRTHAMFHEVWEWAGWTWGGRWRNGAGDSMHIERRG